MSLPADRFKAGPLPRSLDGTHYAETRERLLRDPIIQAMAEELNAATIRGEITREYVRSWSFTQAALHEYRARNGTAFAHIGGPAEAIRELLLVSDND